MTSGVVVPFATEGAMTSGVVVPVASEGVVIVGVTDSTGVG